MKYLNSFHLFLSESQNDIIIDIIKPEHEDAVVDVLYSSFGFLEDSKESLRKRIQPRLSNGISIYLSLNGNIVGCYLLNEKSVQTFIDDIRSGRINDFPESETKIYLDNIQGRGLQGVALSIYPEFRNMGFGKMLKDWVYNLSYDYIWGVADKKLENIDYWKSRRNIIAESPTRWATIEFFKN
jgi:hypothetical protein